MLSHLRLFIAGVILALASLPARAATPDTPAADGPWSVYLAVDDVDKAIEIVGGEWIEAAKLPYDGRPDSFYAGFTLPHANILIVNHKEVLDRFVDQASLIYNNSFDTLSQADVKAIPFNDIICMMLCEGQMRLTTRADITPDANPTSALASYLEVIGNIKAALAAGRPLQSSGTPAE